jgi:hypothetical protein
MVHRRRAEFRFGSIALFLAISGDVCFGADRDHQSGRASRPLCANFGLMHCKKSRGNSIAGEAPGQNLHRQGRKLTCSTTSNVSTTLNVGTRHRLQESDGVRDAGGVNSLSGCHPNRVQIKMYVGQWVRWARGGIGEQSISSIKTSSFHRSNGHSTLLLAGRWLGCFWPFPRLCS